MLKTLRRPSHFSLDELPYPGGDRASRGIVARPFRRVALALEPIVKAKAKERQIATLKQNAGTVKANLPERGQARDEIAKAARVHGLHALLSENNA